MPMLFQRMLVFRLFALFRPCEQLGPIESGIRFAFCGPKQRHVLHGARVMLQALATDGQRFLVPAVAFIAAQ